MASRLLIDIIVHRQLTQRSDVVVTMTDSFIIDQILHRQLIMLSDSVVAMASRLLLEIIFYRQLTQRSDGVNTMANSFIKDIIVHRQLTMKSDGVVALASRLLIGIIVHRQLTQRSNGVITMTVVRRGFDEDQVASCRNLLKHFNVFFLILFSIYIAMLKKTFGTRMSFITLNDIICKLNYQIVQFSQWLHSKQQQHELEILSKKTSLGL